MLPILRLKKHEEKRLLTGHLWIYSNEIDTQISPLKNFSPGELVVIESSQQKKLGTAYVNSHSLICARLISRNIEENLNEQFFVERFNKALQLREQLFDKPYYRLVFGESDGLPGLVIDRFADTLVVQITTAGIENVKFVISSALQRLLNPKAILLRNDSPIRSLEHLPIYIEPLYGEPTEEIMLVENQTCFIAPLWQGQKTGWFYDHRLNRKLLQEYVKNKRVLDVFSYLGGWGIQAALAGAKEVTCIDSSALALSYLAKNAELNHVQDKIHIIQKDAFLALKEFGEAGEKFDVIIIDPPAFIKSRQHLKEGLKGYHHINQLALKLIAPQGLLVSASCSSHLKSEMLLDILRTVSLQQKRFMRILTQGQQSPDHPIHPAMPETNYLKAFFAQVE